MIISLSSSIIRSLHTLPQNALVINSHGTVLFTNSSWDTFHSQSGLSPLKDWVGANYFEQMRELVVDPDHMAKLYDSLHTVMKGERLVLTADFSMRSIGEGSRICRLEAFPLMSEHPQLNRTVVISLSDVSRTESSQQVPAKLVPICASCKSIRNAKEEWICMERFLQEQLSLQFTHDICPDCIRQLYPQYAGALKW